MDAAHIQVKWDSAKKINTSPNPLLYQFDAALTQTKEINQIQQSIRTGFVNQLITSKSHAAI